MREMTEMEKEIERLRAEDPEVRELRRRQRAMGARCKTAFEAAVKKCEHITPEEYFLWKNPMAQRPLADWERDEYD